MVEEINEALVRLIEFTCASYEQETLKSRPKQSEVRRLESVLLSTLTEAGGEIQEVSPREALRLHQMQKRRRETGLSWHEIVQDYFSGRNG